MPDEAGRKINALLPPAKSMEIQMSKPDRKKKPCLQRKGCRCGLSWFDNTVRAMHRLSLRKKQAVGDEMPARSEDAQLKLHDHANLLEREFTREQFLEEARFSAFHEEIKETCK